MCAPACPKVSMVLRGLCRGASVLLERTKDRKAQHRPQGQRGSLMKQEMLTYTEVVKRTGLKIGTLYALVSQKRIPHVRLSSRLVRFPADDIDAWLEAHRVEASSPDVEVAS